MHDRYKKHNLDTRFSANLAICMMLQECVLNLQGENQESTTNKRYSDSANKERRMSRRY
jgi:hypothetical protein